MAMSSEFKWGILASVVLTVAAASSGPWWWQYMPWDHSSAPGSTQPTPSSNRQTNSSLPPVSPSSSLAPTSAVSSSLTPNILWSRTINLPYEYGIDIDSSTPKVASIP